MTFTAIYCEHFGRHVMKAQPCGDKIQVVISARKEVSED